MKKEMLQKELTALHERIAELEHALAECQDELVHAKAMLPPSTAQHQATEKKQHVQMSESEELYRTLVQTSPDAIFLTDLDGFIRFCNHRAAQLFAYASPDSLLGMHSSALVCSNETLLNPLKHADQLSNAQNYRNIEYTMCKQDGNHFPSEVSSSVVVDQEQNPIALIIVVHDISNRKEAEMSMQMAYVSMKELNQDLRQSRNVLRAIFDGLYDGLLLLDRDNQIQAINRAMALLLGDSIDDLIGTVFEGTEFGDSIADLLAMNTTAPTLSRKRIRYHSPDEVTRILDVQTITLSPPEHAVPQTIMHVADVTEHVQLQARLIENERFAASGRLSASVAHEINTPLQALYNSLDLLQIANDQDRETFLAYALKEIKRIGHIVRQLLDMYRPGAKVPGAVDIAGIIERVLLLTGKRLREQRIVVENNIQSELPQPEGREDELTQVILNLIMNALDSMPHGGILRFNGVADQHTLTITVSDTGYGITSDLLLRIFEPFVTTKEKGTGLGLAISSQIVKQHGGTMHVESQPKQGSTFTVLLPLERAYEKTRSSG